MPTIDHNIVFYLLAGFFAQLINSSLGMAFGVLCSSLLLFMGLTPVVASASVHTAELFGTAASGYCHFKLGNVDKKLFKSLLLPGVIGGALGAFVLTHVPVDFIRPFANIYLFIMGVRIVINLLKKQQLTEHPKEPRALGFVAGFLDAIGGGGWGSIATSHLVAHGHEPRLVVGTVNSTRFFVTVVSSAIFFATLGFVNMPVVASLAVGAVLAAPISAPLCKLVKPQALAVAVCLLICGLAAYGLWHSDALSLLMQHQSKQLATLESTWR